MNNQTINPETLRKRNKKMNETSEQHEARLNRERELKRQKRINETDKTREERLSSHHERQNKKKALETTEEREICLAQDRECQRLARDRKKDNDLQKKDIPFTHIGLLLATIISESESNILQSFRTKMNDIQYNSYSVCNERSPSMVINKEKCHHCHLDKNSSKRFSAENNMDPGDVSEQLKDLTEIEEMLIAQVFTVVSVYKLHGGQHGYRGNVINFAQDIWKFTTRLPHHPSSLDILIIHCQSANDPMKFKNFTVHRAKVARALLWLKKNNCYYSDIIIDDKILQSLPENDSIIDQLRQFQDARITDEDLNEDESGDDTIMHNFVPSP